MSAKPRKQTRDRRGEKRHTTMRLPPDVMARLSVVAAREERSRTWIVEKILRDYLAKSAGDLRSVFE